MERSGAHVGAAGTLSAGSGGTGSGGPSSVIGVPRGGTLGVSRQRGRVWLRAVGEGALAPSEPPTTALLQCGSAMGSARVHPDTPCFFPMTDGGNPCPYAAGGNFRCWRHAGSGPAKDWVWGHLGRSRGVAVWNRKGEAQCACCDTRFSEDSEGEGAQYVSADLGGEVICKGCLGGLLQNLRRGAEEAGAGAREAVLSYFFSPERELAEVLDRQCLWVTERVFHSLELYLLVQWVMREDALVASRAEQDPALYEEGESGVVPGLADLLGGRVVVLVPAEGGQKQRTLPDPLGGYYGEVVHAWRAAGADVYSAWAPQLEGPGVSVARQRAHARRCLQEMQLRLGEPRPGRGRRGGGVRGGGGGASVRGGGPGSKSRGRHGSPSPG